MKKRISSILLAIAITVGLIPVFANTVSAEGAQNDVVASGDCSEAVGYGLWIDGEQFSSEKLTIYGETGAATYDPDTKMLTLDNNTNPAIKQSTFLATWTDGDGASYEKAFKYGEVITIPTNEFFEETFRKTGHTLTEWQGYTEGMTMPANPVTFTAVYAPNQYTVTFDSNGGDAIDPIPVTYGEKYGNLPSSAITGLSGGNSNWYLVDQYGNVTDTNIKKLTKVSEAGNHTLFMKRSVLSPNISVALTVPGGISDGYQYYIPGNSTRILTATVSNQNDEVLDYTYQWYKDGNLMEGEAGAMLTLAGNVADSGKYKVVVTATLKDSSNIIVTSNSASAEKELQVKILHMANTISYNANGGEGGPSSNYTGGTTATVSNDVPARENYIFQGWNTQEDGSGESYSGEDIYTFEADNGNGGCTVILYAQWKGESKTVTYYVDGEVFQTDSVEYGTDAVLPAVPEKYGYTGRWDHDGKNITADTVITAVYTENPVTEPDAPQTGDNSNIWLWFAFLFVSGAGIFGLTLNEHKRIQTNK